MTTPFEPPPDSANIAAGFTMRPSEATFPEPDFGPDANANNDIPTEPPFVTDEPPKRNGRKPRTNGRIFASLGQNKKARSAVRKLTEKDRDKIAQYYVYGAMGIMPFRPKAGQVMAASADNCADAWMQLAEENDRVRRAILALMEGGVWGAVFMAHLPILVALVPEESLPPFLRNIDILAMMNMNTPDHPGQATTE